LIRPLGREKGGARGREEEDGNAEMGARLGLLLSVAVVVGTIVVVRVDQAPSDGQESSARTSQRALEHFLALGLVLSAKLFS
jgi:hypothetical protein